MKRLAIAVLAGALATAAAAAPQNQLVVPNLNPGLKTVPFVPQPHFVKAKPDACDKPIVAHADPRPALAEADKPTAAKGETATLAAPERSVDPADATGCASDAARRNQEKSGEM